MNWYKKAEKEKKPFKIIVICFGKTKEMGTIDAYSSEQARMFALRDMSRLRDYLQTGCDVEARLDRIEYDRRKRMEEIRKQKEEDTIQNAWWNK